ncbi:MAG: hypothetical protein AABX71_03215 [Nanoarchaeota archaeon]
MLNKNEAISLVLALVVLAFSNSFFNSSLFLSSLLIFAIILAVYIAAKKYVAYYYEAEEETKIWTFKRFGLYERNHFKNPVPIGIILPFVLSLLTFGYVKWFAVTESDVKPTAARAARRHEFYSFSEMTEWNLALISASGIAASLIIAPIAYLFNFSELARASVYFACFNMLPLGKLDGSRIFFGSLILWSILAVICLIALAYAFLLI